MISLIVVDYKTIPKTYKYIQHFHDMVVDKDLYHYIIVDNSNTKDGIDYMNQIFPKKKKLVINDKNVFIYKNNDYSICYVEASENLGFAKGNNLGTEIADELYKDEYYVISNNDLKLCSKLSWKNIENIFKVDDSIAVIGPRIIGLDKKDQSPYRKVSPFYLLILYQWLRFWPFKSKGDLAIKKNNDFCYRVMGCFMFVKACYFRKVDRFDSYTFMYGEEMILSERLLKYNLKNYYYKDFEIIHEHGATVKKFSSTLNNEKWLFDSIYYYCKKYRNSNSVLLFLARINRCVIYSVIYLKEYIKKTITKN